MHRLVPSPKIGTKSISRDPKQFSALFDLMATISMRCMLN